LRQVSFNVSTEEPQLIVNPKKSITEIAFACGFSGSATFARAFKETFQMSASE